jgi:hypothetical protein
MPLMFQETMRRVFASRGGRAAGAFGEDVCVGTAACALVLRRLADGGLMPRFIFAWIVVVVVA